jgi:UDP-2-acetamido-2,6-beta-L-arabino-hexul-4-ose reductase
MKILITGTNGFIAKNLLAHFRELGDFEVICFSHQTHEQDLFKLVVDVDAVVHLAGVNRPQLPSEFISGNVDLTKTLCQALIHNKRNIPIIFSSSTQAELNNPYGKSKRDAEIILRQYAKDTGACVYIYRLPNVFGKWSKPNYNSVVATFCHNISHDLPISINDENSIINLVYIDDVIDDFIRLLKEKPILAPEAFCTIPVNYKTTVGELVNYIKSFRDTRDTLLIEPVGVGVLRALYATYVSFLSPELFSYKIPSFSDARGVFVEMLKTKNSGQISYFTALSGVTRGGHYHHTKTEKFLVIKGRAQFKFRQISSNETYEIFTSEQQHQIVETVPGWWHDITNVGEDELIVLLWANEVFDRTHPDTHNID